VPVGTPAVDPSDFENFSGAIPITSSEDSVTHTIETINKSVYSGTRGFKVIISDAPSGTEEASTGTIQLVDAAPTYAITVPSSVQEGNSFQFTVDTTNLPNNTTLYYKINGTSGTVNASDFSSGLTGSFVVTGNTKTVTIQTVNNSAYEGTEQFTIQIFDDISLTLPAKTESTPINLLEGTPSYGPLSPNSGSITEGNTQSFSFTTANVANGTPLKYKIVPQTSNVNASDFSPASLTGSFNVGSSFGITLENNIAAEPNETFKIQILTQSDQLVYTSNVFTIVDGEAKYVISANKNSVQEGDGVTFTVNTENVANGTNLIYSLSGSVNAFDFVPVGITGPIVINSNTYQFFLGISADLSSEGTETFTAVVKNDAGSELSNPTSTITISDTSTSFFTITPSSGTIVEGASQTFTVTRTGAGSDGIFYYGITGIKGGSEINEDDFLDGLTGQFTLTSGVGTFQITTLEDTGASNRQFIVKVGTTTDPYNSVIAETNLFTITDLNPEYNLTQSKTTITEGAEGVTFTLQTTNVPAGTSINYTITSDLGSVTQSDFTDNKLSGTITVDSSGYAILYKEANNNCEFETDVFTVTFKNGTSTVAVSQQTTILNATPEFTSISPFGCINGCGCVEGNLQEGSTNSFTVTGCNIPNGSSSYRAVLIKYNTATASGFLPTDVLSTSIPLNFTNNSATFDVNILASGTNTLYEPNDTFVIKIRPQSASSPDYLTSGCFTIIDAQPTGTVTPNVSSVSEGGIVTFNVVVQNVPNGSSIQYEITGIQADDLTDGQLTGNITVTQSGNNYVGSVTKTISTDFDAEGENLTFTIKYNSEVLDDVTIPILDSSQPPIYDFSINRQVLTKLSKLRATLTPQNTPPGTVFRMKLLPNIGTTDVPNNAFQDEDGNPLATSLDFTYDGFTPIEAVWVLNTLEVFEFKIHAFYVDDGEEIPIKISDLCYSFGDLELNPIVFECPGSILCVTNQDGTINTGLLAGPGGGPGGGGGGPDDPGGFSCANSPNDCPKSPYTALPFGCPDDPGGVGIQQVCNFYCIEVPRNGTFTPERDCYICRVYHLGPDDLGCYSGKAWYRDCPCRTIISEPCPCQTCDENRGYTNYTSTPEIFLALHHVPYTLQENQETIEQCGGSPCELNSPPCGVVVGGTYRCNGIPQPCPDNIGDPVCNCFRADGSAYVSYTRFSYRRFRYDEESVEETSIQATDEEQDFYIARGIPVFPRRTQDNCRSCCSTSPCSSSNTPNTQGVAIGCVNKQAYFGSINCYYEYYSNPNTSTVAVETNAMADHNFIYHSNINAGVSSYMMLPTPEEDSDDVSFEPITYFTPTIVGEACSTLTPYTRCQYQNYIYGATLPPGGITGITALYNAEHKHTLWSPECCELISLCSESTSGGCVSTYGDGGCQSFMTETCYNLADKYCKHQGCKFLDDTESSSKEFVYYYQGISGGDTIGERIAIGPDTCFVITEFGSTAASLDQFSDNYFIPCVDPSDVDGCSWLGKRKTTPPQHTGVCFDKSANQQFEAIKFIAELSIPGSALRNNIRNYVLNNLRINIDEIINNCFCTKMYDLEFFKYPYENIYYRSQGLVGYPNQCIKSDRYEEIYAQEEITLPSPLSSVRGVRDLEQIFGFIYYDATQQKDPTIDIFDPIVGLSVASRSLQLIANELTTSPFGPQSTTNGYNFDGHLNSFFQEREELIRNPCSPCHSFINLFNEGPGREGDPLLRQNGLTIEGEGDNQYLQLKSYSNYNYYGSAVEDGAFRMINNSRTLVEQIAGGRIYYKDVCKFIQAALISKIEVLHLTEPSSSQYIQMRDWVGFTGPVNRRNIISKTYEGGYPPIPPNPDDPIPELRHFFESSNQYLFSGSGAVINDPYAVFLDGTSPFGIHVGIARKLVGSHSDIPTCNDVVVYDQHDNIVDCNGINEIIMAGRCFRGPIITKEVWDRIPSDWDNNFGYTGALGKSFKEWITSVTNFNEEIPFANETIRTSFYKMLKDNLYDLPSGIPPYRNEEILRADEERYLAYDSNPKENPYITLEMLQSRIPFEECYAPAEIPPDSALPCLSQLIPIFGGNDLQSVLLVIGFLANASGCSPAIPEGQSANAVCDYNSSSCIVEMARIINLNSSGCINVNDLETIIQQFCEANPKTNPCKFKYNNKFYKAV
jgi:hypothetical protein